MASTQELQAEGATSRIVGSITGFTVPYADHRESGGHPPGGLVETSPIFNLYSVLLGRPPFAPLARTTRLLAGVFRLFCLNRRARRRVSTSIGMRMLEKSTIGIVGLGYVCDSIDACD